MLELFKDGETPTCLQVGTGEPADTEEGLHFAAMTTTSAVLLGLALLNGAAAQDIAVNIPTGLPTRALGRDVYGYSVEPIWVDSYISNSLAATLLGHIKDVTGKAPPLRVGGNTADQTYIHDSLSTGNNSVALPGLPSANQFNITPEWYPTWADYFPEGTDLIYTLNFANNASAWADAVTEAEAVHVALGDKLVMFEAGNEIDHFIHKGWRDATWGVRTYLEQFRNLTGQITSSDWYQSASNPPKFQAGVFADPPWVPDQQDEIDDFSIANLTAVEEQSDRDIIGSYATHLYPQSTCDTTRWLRMRLDLLSNHTTLWLNVSQYIPQVAAADAAGAPLVMGETNSVSCSGKSGISDTFGAALWGVDYVLTAASIGFEKIYFHLGAQSEYSSFTPIEYDLKGEHLIPGIRAGWYGHYFISKIVASASNESYGISALPDANSSSLSGFAVYGGSSQSLRKLVFLDLGVWNGTEGLSNPSTLNATDGTVFSEGERPNSTLSITTPWTAGSKLNVVRLTGPGTNAKSNVTVSGATFDPESGAKVGTEATETITVGDGGVVTVTLPEAHGVLLEAAATSSNSSSSSPGSVSTSGAISFSFRNIFSSTLVVAVGFALLW
ncbi:putative Glycoside hydrolase superfamily [Seiridium cardinale]